MSRRAQSIHFHKVSGAGNHFVLLDARRGRLEAHPILRSGRMVRALCARGHSVGADGVLFIRESRTADFRLAYYNSDGREAALCGNGTRCAALYAFENGLAPARMTIEVGSGTVGAVVRGRKVELALDEPSDFRPNLNLKTKFGLVRGDFVNTGVPHFVTIRGNLGTLDVDGLGREIRRHRAFGSSGANVNFVRVLQGGGVELRTYERGVEAETLACGTGAAAAAVCLAQRGLVRPPVRVRTRGGDTLRVRFKEPSNPLSQIFLQGSAQLVYEGVMGLDTLRAAAGKVAGAR
ncbi:MAG: diaminopimelate epimerase [Candidatus Eisenbacteria bacterium]|nr:diaminopimelate epimerase [Candidatus Eisenbacteria bacterium]